MLNEKQCIEVADKVWGWEKNWVDVEGEDRWPYFADVQQEVNSWQGFGRTVEAMAEKGWCFCDSSSTGICFYKPFKDDIPIDVEFGGENPRSLIIATHLAALEAMKND